MVLGPEMGDGWRTYSLGVSSVLVQFAGRGYVFSVSNPMRLHADLLPEGQLIVAVVQRGEDVCAKTTGRCVVLGPDMIKLEHQPPLEVLTPMFLPHKAQA